MKFTLVNPPATLRNPSRVPRVQPPIGVAYIAAVLREAGHSVAVVDGRGDGIDRISPFREGFFVHGLPVEELVDRIDPDTEAIGIGIMFSNYWPIAKVVIRAIRARFPRTPIICGGEHVTALPEFVMQDAPIDYVVMGEGEETALELLAHLSAAADSRPIESIAGLAYRTADGTIATTPRRQRRRTLDQIPWPAWDLFPLERYLDAHLFDSIPAEGTARPMPILATRGCPYTCKFCSNEQMWGINYFMRDPRDVVDEMEFYVRRYGATDFHFQDLTPIINARWAHRLCEAIAERQLGVTWKTAQGTRCEAIDLELLKSMQRSGCDELRLAPESGSAEILEINRKRVKLGKVLHVSRLIRDHRLPIHVAGYMIFGFPEERLRDSLQSFWYLVQMVLSGFSAVYISRFTAYPGSEYHDIAVREGRIVHNDDYFLNIERNYGLLNFSDTGTTWHPRWSARFILLLATLGYGIFFGTYYLVHPVEAARSAWSIVRNEPRSKAERLVAYFIWRSARGQSAPLSSTVS